MYSALSKPLTTCELFVPRHVKTQPFQLPPEGKWQYDTITKYVNTYLGASFAWESATQAGCLSPQLSGTTPA